MITYDIVEKIYNQLLHTEGGKNADYIHELSIQNPHLYAISIYMLNGEEISIGDDKQLFAIESCSKVFTLALALEKYGISYLKKKIGNKTTREKFNSICAADSISNHTINSFQNGGAMATLSLLSQDYTNKKKFTDKIVDNMSAYAGKKLKVSSKIYKSEISHAERNVAIAQLLDSYGRFYGDVETCVHVYTKQCSVMITTRDGALMAATLANQGTNPVTGEHLVSKENVKYILHHMSIAGLYEETPTWMEKVGFCAKSGVSGLLMIVIPGRMGICIASPPLNSHGNSVKGIKTMKLLKKYI